MGQVGGEPWGLWSRSGVSPDLGIARFCLNQNRLGVRVGAGRPVRRLLKQPWGAMGPGQGWWQCWGDVARFGVTCAASGRG